MAGATLFAVAGEPEEQPQGIMTIEEIQAFYESVKAVHPQWFIEGQGWKSVISEEQEAKWRQQ